MVDLGVERSERALCGLLELSPQRFFDTDRHRNGISQQVFCRRKSHWGISVLSHGRLYDMPEESCETSGTKSRLSYLSWLLPTSRTSNGALSDGRLVVVLQPLIDLVCQMFVWQCRGIWDLAVEQCSQCASSSLLLRLARSRWWWWSALAGRLCDVLPFRWFEPLWTRFHAVFGKPTLKKHSRHPAMREVLRNDCGPVGIFELQQAYQPLARHSGF
jgi:hypothetical protein